MRADTAIRFVVLALIDFIFNLIGYCTNWLWPLFANADGNLPARLKWFQTYDATLDGVGENGHTESRFVRATRWLRDGAGKPRNRVCRYICRSLWLYRNNVYGFGYYVTGAVGPFTMDDASITIYNPSDIKNSVPTNRFPAQGGWRFEWWNKGHYFHFWWVKDRGNGKCWEANFGWKLVAGQDRAHIVARIWPFRAFETTPQ